MIRIARSLFQRVLESDPAAARRLRDEFADRTSQIASDILIGGREARASIDSPTRSMTVHLQRHRHRNVVGGRSQPRASRVMRKSLTPSLSARDTQM